MQAVLDDGRRAFGAVGFQNSVTDSNEDKRNAKRKFNADLQAAIQEKPDLKTFVFFTNVDLTTGEVDELRKEAAGVGVVDADIYWRDRIRQALDSSLGLGLRYQYLKLELSPAEQAAFFNSYNTQLEELILRQHERLDNGVRRLEFLHWMSRPLRQLELDIKLNKFVTADLGCYRVLARLSRPPMSGTDGWYLGGHDNYIQHEPEGQRLRLFGHQTVYSVGAESKLRVLVGTSVHMERVRDIHFGVEFRSGPRPPPEELDGTFMQVFATSNIAQYIATVELTVNGYILARMPKIMFGKALPEIEWPGTTAPITEPVEWLSGTSGPLMLPQITLERTAIRARSLT